jgi:uncharacterized coiled-coil protein SlyX
MPGTNTPPPDRLKAVEEEVGLTELRTEQIERMVGELSSQVFELAKRLETLERRLSDFATRPDPAPDEPPPHAHRPL